MKTKILLIFQLALVKVFLIWQSLAQENKTQVLQSNILLSKIRVCSMELKYLEFGVPLASYFPV